MIIGIGTDIVQIPRIEKIINLYPEIFSNRILTTEELKKFALLKKERRAAFLAKRFAAKEAISKAFGIGIGRGINVKDITVLNDELGKPIVKLDSVYTQKLPLLNIHLSLSDDYPICVAFVIVEKTISPSATTLS